jgi:phosphoglycerol transferase MdoB-like AlkP superfamily enzyme
MQKNLLSRLQRWILVLAITFFIIMTVARIFTFTLFNTVAFSWSSFFKVLWLGFRFDARDVGIMVILMLLLGLIKPLHPFRSKLGKKIAFIIWFIAIIILTVFYTFDYGHFAYLDVRLNAQALDFLHNARISLGMMWQTYHVIWILLGMIVFVAITFWCVRFTYQRIALTDARHEPFKFRSTLFSIIYFLVFGFGIFGKLEQYPLRWSDAFSLNSDFNAQASLNPFQSFFSNLAFRQSTYNEALARKYYPLMVEYLGITQPDSVNLNYVRHIPADTSLPGTHPNIILVISESFSAYKSSLLGNPLNSTPFIDQLAAKSIFFDHMFTPGFGTARDVWTTITGLTDVERNNTASRNPQIVDQQTIINSFKNYGHYYFIGGSTSWANIKGLLENNIDSPHIYEEKYYNYPRLDVWGISDHNLFTAANKVLAEQTRPFFAVIQTADNHRPYSIPTEDLKQFKKITLPNVSLLKYGFTSNDEYNAFRYFDYNVQHFIETIQKEPYFNNTIIAFVGDHGLVGNAEALFPKAYTRQGLTKNHVPFIIYAPKLVKPAKHTMLASQVDVLPILAGLANIPYTNTGMGRDLLHVKDTSQNMAFIFEGEQQELGLLQHQYFVRQPIAKPEKIKLFSMIDNAPVPHNAQTDSFQKSMQTWMQAIYETTRYITHHNKKKVSGK